MAFNVISEWASKRKPLEGTKQPHIIVEEQQRNILEILLSADEREGLVHPNADKINNSAFTPSNRASKKSFDLFVVDWPAVL